MAKAPKIYTRLTRSAAGVTSYSSLWLASDHLLVVSSTGFNETYSRVMLADIEAIYITESSRQMWWGLGWGVFALVFGIRVIAVLSMGDTPTTSAVFLALLLGAIAWNAVMGAGCRVYLMTGVQTIPLPALVRRKKTRRVLDRLRPLIVAAQAGLAAPADQVPAAAPSAEPATEPPAAPETPPAAS